MFRVMVCAAALGVGCAASGCADRADDDGPRAGAQAAARDAEAPSLCAKYGGTASVDAIVAEHVLARIAADCRIQAFFAGVTPAGMIRVRDCLSIQVQELMGCEGVQYAGSFASNGLECRDMRKSHIGLGIGAADFDALLEDVVAGLEAAGVDRADIEAAAPALLALKSTIVEAEAPHATRDACDAEGSPAEADRP